MKRFIMFCAVVASLAILVTGCGGGGSGSGGGIVGGGGATTGTFTKEVAFTTGPDYWYGTEEARFMNLYLAEDIQGSGWITSISVKHHLALSSPATCPDMTIRMGHTGSDNLVTTFATNIENGKGSFQTVFNGTVSVPAGGDDTYYSIPLSQPFYYNGVDNLVVDLTYLSSCSASAGIVAHATPYDANVFETGPGSSTDPTGSVVAQLIDMKFNFAGGDDIVVGFNGAGSNYIPFRDLTFNDQKVQLLYTAAEINGSGPITGIGFPVGTAAFDEANYTVNVRMGHTNLTALATGAFANSFNAGAPVTVASGVNFSVPAGLPVDSYVWIPLPHATFNYNGTDNLVVEVEITSAAGPGTAWKVNSTPTVSNRRLYGASGALTGTADNSYYCVKFRFAGGTMDVITQENVYVRYPYGIENNKQQFLYRAAELGTKGSISRLAYRLRFDSVASSYGSFELVLGHTANTTLGDTSFSANMTGAQTVYSGTYSIPAGLKAGDWIEVPLSTPFAYDGVRNLVVQTSNLSGSDNFISAASDATRYPNRRSYLSSNTGDDPGGRDGVLADLRLILQ